MASTSCVPLVSVVTPFHNTAAYLRECIQSVLSQSYEHFEYILQDNASNDGSSEIAREFTQRDARIKYLRMDELVPQVSNYNLALERISPLSVYCKIVQADDCIYKDCLRSMVDLAERSSQIGLTSSFRLQEKNVSGEDLHYTQSITSGRDVARLHLLGHDFLFGSPTTILYRSEIVRKRRPFYSVGRLHEDTEACYEILGEWDFGFVHQILSFSRASLDSIYGQMRQHDTGILDKRIVLHRYGRDFLTGSEFRTRTAEIERRYYRRLANALLSARGRAYWRFHRDGLATEGLRIAPVKLIRALGKELLSLLACPLQAVGLIRNWTRRPAD
ncbi:MAG: glycosyltransferase family 2 protein [Pyrinomonadaceae bacterium]